MRVLKYFIIGFLLVVTDVGQAQTDQRQCFRQFTLDDGLRSMQVFSILQDQRGYMWFATNKGVSVYNGHAFKNYTVKNGLKDNSILTLHEDYKGRIWFASYTGEINYIDNDSLYHLAIPEEWKGWGWAMTPSKLMVTKGDTLWVGMENGYIDFLKVSINDPTHYSFPDTNAGIASIRLFGNGAMVHSGSKNIRGKLIIDSNNKEHLLFQIDPSLVGMGSSESFFSDHQGLLLTHEGALLEWKNEQLDTLLKFDSYANLGLLRDEDNNLFIPMMPSGVLWYKPNAYDQAPDTLLPNDLITSVIRDHEGGYWFGTYASGVFYTSTLTSTGVTNFPLQGNLRCRKVHTRGNKILRLYSDGLMTSVSLGEDRKLDEKKLLENTLYLNWITDSLIYLKRSYNYFPRNILYNVRTEQLSDRPNPGTIVQLAIPYTPDKCMRLSTEGLETFGYNSGIIDTLYASSRHRWFSGALYKGQIWGSDQNGIWTLQNGELVHPFANEALNSIKATAFHEINGVLTIATGGLGLVVVDSNNTVHIINEENGLNSDFCSDLTSDTTGSLWVATERGITRFRNFDIHGALQPDYFLDKNNLTFRQINKICLVDNYIWAFAENGLNLIDPYEPPSTHVTPSYIEAVLVGDSLIDHKKHLYLDYDQANLRMEYTALTYRNSSSTNFKFRLLGSSDTSWTTTKVYTLEFSQLRPGQYTFEVGVTGAHAGPIDAFSFTVHPPIWRQWWFIVLVILAAIALVVLLVKVQIRRIQKIASLQTSMLISEQKALRAQINPHFIFNAINSILALISRKENDRADAALHQFASLMRNTLTYSELLRIPLEDEINSITQYLELEKLRLDQNLLFTINTNGINLDEIEIPPMIIQPFIENAVKHGLFHKRDGIGKLTVDFFLKNRVLTCEVDDNGIGRKASKAIYEKENFHNNGSGMSITASRIDLVNQTSDSHIKLEIIDKLDGVGNSAGTKIVLTFALEEL